MNAAAPRERGLFLPAAGCLALAGAVFVLVYSACNRLTASREDVPAVFFEWERGVPLVRELIIPYWSLDLFFCGAFFLCRTRLQLRTLTIRLILVVLLSGACFLGFPLRFGWERPEPEGWTAALFRALYANDLPFNMAPSLHISLRSLLWIVYGRHLRGRLRSAVKVWFIVIGLSTILVWQHHLLDVATGFFAGWMVQALVPDSGHRAIPLTAPYRRMALRTGLACLILAGLALPGGSWLWLAWPAVATGIMAAAHLRRDARLPGKENGTLSPAAEWCLLPWLLGARLVQHRWLRSRPPAREVTPGVWFGRRHTPAEASALTDAGPLAVLDLTAESNAPPAFRERAVYCSLPLLDLVPVPPSALQEAVSFIRDHAGSRTVLIHCQLGLQRSATVAAAWLVSCGLSAADAAERVRALAPGAKIQG